MAENDDLERKLQAGIEAVRRGDRVTARRLLEQVVTADENNELGWIWLASSVNTLSERRACLEKVLQINPDNARAREALRKLTGESGQRAGRDQERRTIEQLRKIEHARQTTSRPEEQRSGLNFTYLIGAGLLIIAVIAVGVVGSNLLQQAQATPTPAALVQGPTETPSPVPPTPTLGNFAGTRLAPTLPPTFTSTFTPTATITPTNTATPYPLSSFLLFYTRLNPGDTVPSLYSINADGTNEQFLAADVEEIAIDITGKKIAFVRHVTYEPDDISPDGGTWPEIFVAPLNNLDAARQITELRRPITGSPNWAPDSLQIVFVSDYDGDEDLWAMTDDGQNIRQLTVNDGVIDRDPAWSPDGSRIVFASDRDTPGLTEIYSLEIPSSDDADPVITRLTDDAGSSYAPSWSPDGSRITFISDRGGDGDVYIMDGDGQRPFLLTFDDGSAEDRHPAFTPDQRWVTFISNREDDFFQIYLVNQRGSELVRVSNNASDIQFIAFRPEVLLSLR